jgi:hypothetical protein
MPAEPRERAIVREAIALFAEQAHTRELATRLGITASLHGAPAAMRGLAVKAATESSASATKGGRTCVRGQLKAVTARDRGAVVAG